MQKQEYLYKAPNHAANLNEMRLKDKWCDVTIKVNGKEIRAHKMILAANLMYFDAMFSDESFEESKDGIIKMESVEEADLETFVSYAYTGEILLTANNALNLLELANYLSEDGIKEACIDFLKDNLIIEEACRAYQYGSNINCLSLKNVAKETILKNFKDCSKSDDFLDFDCNCLTDILSDGKTQSAKLQKIFFEGMMTWIIHDAENRKIHMNELLSTIDIMELASDDLIGYLYEKTVDHDDKYGIVKDIVFYYQASKIAEKKTEQALMILGIDNTQSSFQSYNFTENKWSSPVEITGAGTITCFNGVFFNNKLYYISKNSETTDLRVFDPVSKRSKILNSSDSISNYTALVACTKFIYLCGGIRTERSDQVVKYDPQTDSLVTLSPMTFKRYGADAIFFEGYLYVAGGFSSDYLNSVEKYDFDTKKWTTVSPMCEKRYGLALAVLNGKLYACGGIGSSTSVEVYDAVTNSWKLVASMNKQRNFFVVAAYKGKLISVGGSIDKTVEVYDPIKDQWQIDSELSSGLKSNNIIGGLISLSCNANKK